MPISLERTIVLFFLMASGYAAAKARVLDAAVTKGISGFAVRFALPALILSSMDRPFEEALAGNAALMLILSVAFYMVAIGAALILSNLYSCPGPERGVHAFAMAFSNVAFVGYPILGGLFGQEAVFLLAIYNIPFQVFAFSIGLWMISRGSRAKGGPRLDFKAFLNPAAISALLGFGLYLLSARLPLLLAEGLELLGGVTTPLGMIVVGAALARTKISSIVKNPRVYATSIYRLLALPLAVYGLLRLAGLSGFALSVPTMVAALPVAVNSAILSEAYGGDSETASGLVFISTLASVATIPLLAGLLFGV